MNDLVKERRELRDWCESQPADLYPECAMLPLLDALDGARDEIEQLVAKAMWLKAEIERLRGVMVRAEGMALAGGCGTASLLLAKEVYNDGEEDDELDEDNPDRPIKV